MAGSYNRFVGYHKLFVEFLLCTMNTNIPLNISFKFFETEKKLQLDSMIFYLGFVPQMLAIVGAEPGLSQGI